MLRKFTIFRLYIPAVLMAGLMAQLLLDKEEAAKYSKKLDAGSTVELSSDKLKELVEGN